MSVQATSAKPPSAFSRSNATLLSFKAMRARRRLPKIHAVIALILLVGALAVAACVPSQDAPLIEQRAQRLNETIMCPVCPGESIDQSQNMLAAQMRGVVDEKLSEGWSDEQIREYFVERYGPSVLLEPPSEGFDLLAWTLPAVLVAAAGVALFIALRTMTRSRPTGLEDDGDATLPDEEFARYTRLVQEAVDGAEGGRPSESSGAGKSAQS